MKSKTPKPKKKKQKIVIEQGWEPINPHAAGIDIGSREHFACVPGRATADNVRSFGTFTADLEALADWFQECGVTSVAMEATGVYWIAVYQLLERRGLQVLLVNARQIRQPVLSNDDIATAFDGITYSKGGAVLSMFRSRVARFDLDEIKVSNLFIDRY